MDLGTFGAIGVWDQEEVNVKKTVDVVVRASKSHNYGVAVCVIGSVGESTFKVILS